MTVALYRDDGATPLDGVAFTNLERGQDSDSIAFQVRAEGGDHHDVLLLLRTRSPTDPSAWLASGVPPQDELWGRLRVVGEDNLLAPEWRAPRIDWTVWGAYTGLLIPFIPAGAAALCEMRMRPPSTAAELSWTWGVVPLYEESSRPLPPVLDQVDRGVLPRLGDRAASFVLRGRAASASAVPDDQVHVTAGLWVRSGELEADVGQTVSLDQTDGTGEALVAGESYVALLSQPAPGTVTTQKGARALAPLAPAPPAGEPPLASVVVRHQPGGVTVVEPEDVTDLRPLGRYDARPGVGLEVSVGPGQALGAGSWRYQGGRRPVVVVDEATSYLWLLGSGQWTATTTAEPPESAALGPLWEADASGGAVVAIRDRRTYAGRAVHLVLRGSTAAPGFVDERMIEHPRLWLEAVTLRASDNGQAQGASSGETVGELLVNGASAYPDPAVEDLRPRVAWDADAAALVDRDGLPLITLLERGDVVRFDAAQLPTGGAPERLELHLTCRVA